MERAMKDSGVVWIGEIPEHWQQNTVFQIFTQVKNRNSELQEKNLLSLSYGKIKRKDIETTEGLLPESFDGYNIIEPGDIVLRLTDLQNDQRSLRVGLATERGIVTSAYLTIRPRSQSQSQYLYYFLHAFDISKGFYGMGAGVRQGLNWDGIKWLRILVPPLPEQSCIAAFLDRRCAEIDRVIAATQRTIEEYKKLKQSIITEAVTHGVRGPRKMKNTGVEWIEPIPDEWKVTRAKHVLKKLERSLEDDDKIVICSNSGNVLYRGDNNPGLVSITENGYQGVEPGDLLIHGMDTWHGAIAVSNIRGKCTSVVHVCDTEECKEYVCYYLQSLAFRKVYKAITNGVRQNTSDYRSWDKAGSIALLLPPRDEQLEIAAFIKERSSIIDRLIEAKQRLLGELDAYKKSVIYEYVTGKKEAPDTQDWI